MPQPIIRTEDVVECLDDRIHASQDHPQINVLNYDPYTDILSKIELQVCSPEQKDAIDRTLTSPSDLNPVVLKDDIETYYPIDDLGGFKDAVTDIVDLPLTGNSLNDMRPVLSISAIYRWDGVAWQPFIRTGTIDHTQLINPNGDSDFLHMSLAELASLTTQSHTHPNKDILDSIALSGSGIIISTAERSRLPTSDQKDALEGSVYVPPMLPSSTNRYVTTIDPRLNTIKNPYVTFGQLGTGTTYQGDTIIEFQLALNAIASGSVEFINALEVLPATYLNDAINYLGLEWTAAAPLLIEALAFRATVFQLAPQPAGSTAFLIGAGDGQVTIRGITFELGGTDLVGLFIERDNVIIEDCTFTTSSSPSPTGNIGIRISANNVKLRRCIFSGNLVQGVEILGDGCYIETCRFDLNASAYPALSINGSNTQVTSCIVSQGAIEIGTVSNTILDKMRLTSNVIFTDLGENTRWLGSVPQDYQQAYIGRTRTVGLVNSYGDFRGDSEVPFLAALADQYTTEIEVLEGTYTFTSPVVIPAGKTIRATRDGTVVIHGANCFILNSFTRIHGLTLSVTGDSGIVATSVNDVEITRCNLTMNGPDDPMLHAVSVSDITDLKIEHCKISGTRGIKIVNGLRPKVIHTLFSTSISVETDVATTDLHYAENIEEGSTCLLYGANAIIRGNHFLGALPTKLNTINSLWTANYPTTANNHDAIDTLSISLGDLIHPVLSTGAERSSFLGTASIAFSETGTPTVVTPPIHLKERIDRTQGYHVMLSWTAPTFSGSVLWEVSVVFRDRDEFISDLGTPTVRTISSPRTFFTVRQEEKAILTFNSSDYGYMTGIDPTHVSILIRRLGDDGNDTMGGIAYLTEAEISFTRD